MSFMAAGDEYDDDLDFYDYGGSLSEREPAKKTFVEPTLSSLVKVEDSIEEKSTANDCNGEQSTGRDWGGIKPRDKCRGWSRNRPGSLRGLSRLEEMKVVVCAGDVEAVREKLDQGFNPNTPLVGDWSPLMYACSEGRPSVAELLLEKGADVNYQKDMFTVLMALCASKTSDESELAACCRELLSRGARVNSHDRYHMTPLLYACDLGHRELASILISANADINKQDTRGWTPLCYAANVGNLPLVKLLLKSGANPELPTNLGDTPALLAYNNSHNAVGNTLEAAVRPQDGDAEGEVAAASSSRSAIPPSTTVNGKCFRYGDLELFLMGLELGHLAPLFNRHMVKFSDLLATTEEDLEKMGVAQVGVRRTLLTAIADIHKSRWRMPYNNPYKNRVLSPQEFIVALTQLSKHISYVRSTACFLLKQTRGAPSPVAVETESHDHAKLAGEMVAVTTACRALDSQVRSLEVEVYKGLGTRPPTSGRTLFGPKTRLLRGSLFLGAIGGLVVIFWYGRDGVLPWLAGLRNMIRH